MSPKSAARVALLLTVCFLATSCKHGGDYQFDTVTFRVSEADPPLGSAPNVHIDTNLTVSGMWGGTVRTSKPYSIGLEYTDETFTCAAAEIARVSVTYADGTTDPGAAALTLPVRFPSRTYECTNSVAGGRIVKTNLRVISGKIPGAVTRDQPFALRVEGKLIRDDSTSIPFAVQCKYEVVTNKTTKPWGEVMQDK
jgi:hypothetical protein